MRLWPDLVAFYFRPLGACFASKSVRGTRNVERHGGTWNVGQNAERQNHVANVLILIWVVIVLYREIKNGANIIIALMI